MKTIKILLFSMMTTLMVFSLVQPAMAGLLSATKTAGLIEKVDKVVENTVQLGESIPYDLEIFIGRIIRSALSVIGLIFIILVLLTGIDWMKAAGNEEVIRLSKSRLQSLLIGLAVILLAFALSYEVAKILAPLLKSE